MNPYYYNNGYDMGLGSLFSLMTHIAIIVLVVWFIIWIIRSRGGGRGHRFQMWQTHSALNILNERFAKGEIDQKEYEERKKALMNPQP